MAEGGGSLAFVARGQARVLTPGVAGDLVPSADLGPGDAFGLAALLGHETGAELEASTEVALLVLDDEAIAVLAATLPSVAAALSGDRVVPAPAGGRRLSRVTMAPRPAVAAVAVEEVASREARRLTGALPAARP